MAILPNTLSLSWSVIPRYIFEATYEWKVLFTSQYAYHLDRGRHKDLLPCVHTYWRHNMLWSQDVDESSWYWPGNILLQATSQGLCKLLGRESHQHPYQAEKHSSCQPTVINSMPIYAHGHNSGTNTLAHSDEKILSIIFYWVSSLPLPIFASYIYMYIYIFM